MYMKSDILILFSFVNIEYLLNKGVTIHVYCHIYIIQTVAHVNCLCKTKRQVVMQSTTNTNYLKAAFLIKYLSTIVVTSTILVFPVYVEGRDFEFDFPVCLILRHAVI